MLPTISVAARSSRDRINSKKANFQTAGTQNYWNHGFTVNFSQPVFHWEHWIQLDQSSNRIAKAEADYQAELQNLIVKTTEAYFNILAAEDNLQFTVSELKAIERQLEQAQQRFDVGLIAITDVYEAQAGVDQARANQIDAENNLDDSKEALIEIIGEHKIELNSLSKTINLSPPSPNNSSEWSKVAETSNLTIISALNQAEVISSRSRQAHFDYKVAKEELLSVKQQVKRQVRNSFRDINSSINRVQALEAAVASAESSLEATLAGAEVGTRTMVDVLSEQKNLYRAKRDYSRTRYDYLISGIKLKQAASSLTEQDLELINQYLIQ